MGPPNESEMSDPGGTLAPMWFPGSEKRSFGVAFGSFWDNIGMCLKSVSVYAVASKCGFRNLERRVLLNLNLNSQHIRLVSFGHCF